MARDPRIEAALHSWAEAVTVGCGDGYAAVNVLHESWSPPPPGRTPAMKVALPTDVRRTHWAIGMLSQRLRNTVVVHYCLRLSVAEQALRLECGERTVHARVEEAHRQLAARLAVGFCNMHEPRYSSAT